MRLIHSRHPLPRHFARHPGCKGLLLEKDLAIGSSRLRAKLLVFRNRTFLREFWKGPLGKSELGRNCDGAVNSLLVNVERFNGRGRAVARHLEADPRYFCIIGLIRECMGMEVIAHEAVHAGFCYVKRVKRSPWDDQAKMQDEEAVAYPAGVIAQCIGEIYWKHFNET